MDSPVSFLLSDTLGSDKRIHPNTPKYSWKEVFSYMHSSLYFVCRYGWRPEHHVREWALSFHHVGPED